MKKAMLGMTIILLVCGNLHASENDAFACESVKKTSRGLPESSLVVYKSKSAGQKLIVTLGEKLPTPYACSKSVGSVNNAKYTVYQCANGINEKRAILSINADKLDARLELEVNNKSYEMICEINPTIMR